MRKQVWGRDEGRVSWGGGVCGKGLGKGIVRKKMKGMG